MRHIIIRKKMQKVVPKTGVQIKVLSDVNNSRPKYYDINILDVILLRILYSLYGLLGLYKSVLQIYYIV